MKGFKSFPDRTRLEFSPGVSVVVGPNGSGKSNITDAVLWAMGEQSPLAVRGQSMQDVIFAGAHGVQARSEAEVEVVLDNGDGTVDLPASEVAITRRLDRAGEGEYRVNGAKCRLVDVLEILSDTGLGKEMHSVVSQGRVESIVTSKPRDRRLLIEEAAGLGKHRKRRRRAQLKLDRTQDNLDRALDIEREARARLRPLKRQAEAAELHERLERQTDEARWTLAGEDARGGARGARGGEDQVRGGARGLRARSRPSWQAARGARAGRGGAGRPRRRARGAGQPRLRRALRGRADRAAARGRPRRGRARSRTARSAAARCSAGSRPRRARTRATTPAPPSASRRWRPSSSSSPRTATSGWRATSRSSRRGGRPPRRSCERLSAEADRVGAARREADAAVDAARRARREVEAGVERARREAAKVGAELAAVNQFLRSHVGAPGGAPALADALRAEPGYELALAAALGPRLRAAVAVEPLRGRRAARPGGQGRRRCARRAACDASAPRAALAPRRARRPRPPPAPSRCARASAPRATAPRRRSPSGCSPTCGSSSGSTGSAPTSAASP